MFALGCFSLWFPGLGQNPGLGRGHEMPEEVLFLGEAGLSSEQGAEVIPMVS